MNSDYFLWSVRWRLQRFGVFFSLRNVFFKCGITIFQRGSDSGPERSGALDSGGSVAYITVSTASRGCADPPCSAAHQRFLPFAAQITATRRRWGRSSTPICQRNDIREQVPSRLSFTHEDISFQASKLHRNSS